MKAVWKYQLDHVAQCQLVKMPEGAKILCVKVQHEIICVWAEVDTEVTQMKNRCIEIVGTGHEMDTSPSFERWYIGTVFMRDGYYVWHIYERT